MPSLFQSIKEDELAYWLLVHRIPGIGPKRFAVLLAEDSSLSNYFSGLKPTQAFVSWCRQHGVSDLHLDWHGVEKDLTWASQTHCTILSCLDERYPDYLKQIPSRPPLLFVEGQVDVLKLRQLAMVGSRQPTAIGKENAYDFAYGLTQQGLTITSGLALGIDAKSHEGALAAGGVTIAVLGNSLEKIYPMKHQSLAEQIKAKGALVSEFPIGTHPKAEHFPIRNRIISGLSIGVLVIESALKSGSLITARYAVEQGREVFALPGSIHNPLAKGCHQLIRQGAKCVDSLEHILEEFPLFPVEKSKNTPYSVSSPRLPSLSALSTIQSQLFSYIGEACTSIDTIVNKSGLSSDVVSSTLLELELMEKITTVPGGVIRTVGDV